MVGVPLLHPDLPSLLTASGDSLGESGEEALPGECQPPSRVLQTFNNFYKGNHWHPLQPVGDGVAHAHLRAGRVTGSTDPAPERLGMGRENDWLGLYVT